MTEHGSHGDRQSEPLDAYLGLGANLGRRAHSLAAALELLDEVEGLALHETSSVYETAPVGVTEQPTFLNMVAHFGCTLSPLALLDAALSVERRLGRIREARWGPRTIDIDVLLLGEMRVDTRRLRIPHPELTRRQFVLVPLAEIAPDVVLPGGATAQELSAGESGEVRRLGSLVEVMAREQTGEAGGR
ncbi:MAG: 2-amino-4-hydroxy-6-hydroxymethyldihydropteridine diphosphokinase [Armatimonadota bacterium]|nr:2-amino-4-hydroxy-6-hydroxymethyldihydropteridine diphosphokinase [Armatimonadota bacterium]